MDRQTLRDCVHRYNNEGVLGLSSRLSTERPAALNEAQMAELRALVLAGPDHRLVADALPASAAGKPIETCVILVSSDQRR
jgi:hypothetical protein